MASFTICICTHNRADHLERCLQSLVDHMPEGMDVPVLVVDNASTDNTREVAESFAGRLVLEYLHEPKPGLSRARNAGWRACGTEYIVYLDDDARATSRWIPAIATGLINHQPDYFGGAYVPFYLEEKPDWFLDKYGSMYLGRREGELAPGDLLSGGNMGWRVSLLEELGGFAENLGMVGGAMGLGEETQLILRTQNDLPHRKGVFLGDMTMEHLVPAEKFALGYWLRRGWKHGLQDRDIHGGGMRITVRWLVKEVAMVPFIALLVVFRNRRRFPRWQNIIFEYGRHRMVFWGRVYSALGGRG